MTNELPVTNIYDVLKWVVLALIVAGVIIIGCKLILQIIEKWEKAAELTIINELQSLIYNLPVNTDSFDRIMIEFSKLELTEVQEDTLYTAFLSRFDSIAKKRQTVNRYASAHLKARLENRRKFIESELNDIIRDREKSKSLFDRQQTNAKEQVLILLLNEYNDLLSEPEKKKEPEKTEAYQTPAPTRVKKEKKTVEALTLTL